MQGLDPTDPEAAAAGGQGLQVEVSQGAGGEEVVEGESHRGGSKVLGDVRVGCWQAARARAPAEAEGEGAGSKGEEGGPGPP